MTRNSDYERESAHLQLHMNCSHSWLINEVVLSFLGRIYSVMLGLAYIYASQVEDS